MQEERKGTTAAAEDLAQEERKVHQETIELILGRFCAEQGLVSRYFTPESQGVEYLGFCSKAVGGSHEARHHENGRCVHLVLAQRGVHGLTGGG